MGEWGKIEGRLFGIFQSCNTNKPHSAALRAFGDAERMAKRKRGETREGEKEDDKAEGRGGERKIDRDRERDEMAHYNSSF